MSAPKLTAAQVRALRVAAGLPERWSSHLVGEIDGLVRLGLLEKHPDLMSWSTNRAGREALDREEQRAAAEAAEEQKRMATECGAKDWFSPRVCRLAPGHTGPHNDPSIGGFPRGVV